LTKKVQQRICIYFLMDLGCPVGFRILVMGILRRMIYQMLSKEENV